MDWVVDLTAADCVGVLPEGVDTTRCMDQDKTVNTDTIQVHVHIVHMYMYNVHMCVIMTEISKPLHNIVSLAAPDDMEMYSGMCGR